MKARYKVASAVLIALSIVFFLNAEFNITGAVIGAKTILSIPSLASSFIGFALIVAAIALLGYEATLESTIEAEQNARVEREAKLITNYNENSVILDANFLIQACHDSASYNEVKRIVERHYSAANPVIIPRSVLKELKLGVGDQAEKQRRSNLKTLIEEKTLPIEADRPQYKSREKEYSKLSEEILKQTPKYFTHLYLKDLDSGSTKTPSQFLAELRIKGLIDSRNPYSSNEILQGLSKGQREYAADSRDPARKKRLLHRYDLSSSDIEVFTNALYLNNVPSIYGSDRKDRVVIASADDHLLDAPRVMAAMYPKRSNKVVVEPLVHDDV